MSPTDDDPIWYASYGSNCLVERFEAYLTGGQALGTDRPERGARDARQPSESAPFWFPTGVRFLGDSKKWGGGGVAFLDHTGGAPAPGRRYLVTRGQFDDLAAQESGRDRVALPTSELEPGELRVVGSGWYDGLLAFEPIGGIPIVTFTSPRPLADRPVRPPSAAYLGTILRGLLQVHALPPERLVGHLLSAPGVEDGWTAEQVLRLAEK